MPSDLNIYALIQRKLDSVGINRESYTLNDDYKDDSLALYNDGDKWFFGSNERGKKSEIASFRSGIAAAEYLIFFLYKKTDKLNFPNIDWTEYASLP
jgi:hypothetical protein